jgi:hypothetical protein
MEKFEAPVELDDIELDAVAGGILNDINFIVLAAVVNSTGSTATTEGDSIVDNSTSDTDVPTP